LLVLFDKLAHISVFIEIQENGQCPRSQARKM